jgi:hypothetical protein
MPLANPSRQRWVDSPPTLRLLPGERERFEAQARELAMSRPFIPRAAVDIGKLGGR